MIQKTIKSHRMERRDRAQKMLAICSEFFGYSEQELIGRSRAHLLSQARQISMATIHEMSLLTLAETGNIFGKRDHGTVSYAVNAVRDMAVSSPDGYADYCHLRNHIIDKMRARVPKKFIK